jgi:hypothetical protein
VRLGFFYGWVIVASAFVTMAIAVNARTAFSLLFPPVVDELGWERAVTAGAFSYLDGNSDRRGRDRSLGDRLCLRHDRLLCAGILDCDRLLRIVRCVDLDGGAAANPHGRGEIDSHEDIVGAMREEQ